MIFTTAKHDCMQFIMSKSSLILFKTRYPLVVYHENADVLPFTASLQSKSYFSPLERGLVINIGWPHGFALEV